MIMKSQQIYWEKFFPMNFFDRKYRREKWFMLMEI